MSMTLIQVAIGGAIGASLRYVFGVGTLRAFGAEFPYGTMMVNVVGSLLMGFLVVVLSQTNPKLMPFLMTGILGGFTTFSAFSLDAMRLYENGHVTAAAAYVVGSVALSLGALFLGVLAARAVI